MARPFAKYAPGLSCCVGVLTCSPKGASPLMAASSGVVNNRDKNFTRAKMERRLAQIEESVARYLRQLDSADRQEPSEARTTKTTRLKEKIAKLKEEVKRRLCDFAGGRFLLRHRPQ